MPPALVLPSPIAATTSDRLGLGSGAFYDARAGGTSTARLARVRHALVSHAIVSHAIVILTLQGCFVTLRRLHTTVLVRTTGVDVEHHEEVRPSGAERLGL